MIKLADMIQQVKDSPEYGQMGMIVSHLGVVRSTSRDGGAVRAVHVKFEPDKITEIINNINSMDGIYKVLVEFNEGELQVGEEIMAVVVGGDIRERVFPALMRAVDCIKADASQKKEIC